MRFARILLAMLVLSSSFPLITFPESQQPTVQRLDQTIREVISKREYQWRLPKQKSDREIRGGAFAQFFETLLQWLKDFGNWILDLWRKLRDWYRRSTSPSTPSFEPEASPGIQESLLLILIGLVAAVLIFFVVRLWRKKRKARSQPIQTEPLIAEPNLTDENVLADSLPENRWQSLANELMKKGEFRLALRALYMAVLASLGERDYIRIARYKSNREYQREVERRAREREEIIQAFSENVRLFERAWYGSHPVTEEIIDLFAMNHDRIKEVSEKQAV